MQQDYDHRTYGRLMLRCLEAEAEEKAAVDRLHCVSRIAAQFMISLAEAERFLNWSNAMSADLFFVGNTIPRKDLH